VAGTHFSKPKKRRNNPDYQPTTAVSTENRFGRKCL
jgi:hypothetical protein